MRVMSVLVHDMFIPGELAQKDIEDRRKQQPEQGHPKHPEEYGNTYGVTHLRAGTT
jgi:hypothetical protein